MTRPEMVESVLKAEAELRRKAEDKIAKAEERSLKKELKAQTDVLKKEEQQRKVALKSETKAAKATKSAKKPPKKRVAVKGVKTPRDGKARANSSANANSPPSVNIASWHHVNGLEHSSGLNEPNERVPTLDLRQEDALSLLALAGSCSEFSIVV